MRVEITFLFLAALLPSDGIVAAEESAHIPGVRQEITTNAVGKVTTYYRDDQKVLKKIVPEKEFRNVVYYIYLDGRKILTYKSGPAGTEFRSADQTRQLAMRPYTIKMAGDKESRVNRITIYTDDFVQTLDGFWLRNNAVIPWTSAELAKHRALRDPATDISSDQTSASDKE